MGLHNSIFASKPGIYISKLCCNLCYQIWRKTPTAMHSHISQFERFLE